MVAAQETWPQVVIGVSAAGCAASFFHRASVYYTWFEACHLQAVKLFLTVNSGKCQLLLLSYVVCVSSEEKHWRTTCHPLPVVNVPVCPPVFIWTVLSRWKITKHGAVWDCVRLTFSGSTSLLFVVVVVLLSFVSSEETSEVSGFIHKREKNEAHLAIVISTRNEWYKRSLLRWNTVCLAIGFYLGVR